VVSGLKGAPKGAFGDVLSTKAGKTRGNFGCPEIGPTIFTSSITYLSAPSCGKGFAEVDVVEELTVYVPV
jgi:hypothetical protein